MNKPPYHPFKRALKMQPLGLMNADLLLLRIALKTADVYVPPVYQRYSPEPVADLQARGLITVEPAFGPDQILRITPAGLAYAFEHLIKPEQHAVARKEIAEWAGNVEDRMGSYRDIRNEENARRTRT